MSTRKVLREQMKQRYLEKIIDLFKNTEEVLRTGSNEIAFPIVDDEGNEDFINIIVKIPTGAHGGGDPYDGYSLAEAYEIKCRNKAEEAEEHKKKVAKALAEKEKAKKEKTAK